MCPKKMKGWTSNMLQMLLKMSGCIGEYGLILLVIFWGVVQNMTLTSFFASPPSGSNTLVDQIQVSHLLFQTSNVENDEKRF